MDNTVGVVPYAYAERIVSLILFGERAKYMAYTEICNIMEEYTCSYYADSNMPIFFIFLVGLLLP